MYVPRHIASVVLGVVTCTMTSALADPNPSATPESAANFKALHGEFQKREQLCALMRPAAAAAQSTSARDESLVPLLALALDDESPVVVEQAVNVVGHRKQAQLTDKLIALYAVTGQRFGGYSERVRLAIVSALGKLEATDASALFAAILNRDNATILAQQTLLSIQACHSVELADDVQAYALKMEAIIEQAQKNGHDPMLYSAAQRNAETANTVLSTLR